MAKYKVTVIRTGYSQRKIEIEAPNEHDAALRALDVAGDCEFPEHDADYVVDYVE